MTTALLLLLALPCRDECWRQSLLYGEDSGRWQRRYGWLPESYARDQLAGFARVHEARSLAWLALWDAADPGKPLDTRLYWIRQAGGIPPPCPIPN